MLPDRVSNPGPLTYESGALPTALHGPAQNLELVCLRNKVDYQSVEKSTNTAFSCPSKNLTCKILIKYNIMNELSLFQQSGNFCWYQWWFDKVSPKNVSYNSNGL